MLEHRLEAHTVTYYLVALQRMQHINRLFYYDDDESHIVKAGILSGSTLLTSGGIWSNINYPLRSLRVIPKTVRDIVEEVSLGLRN